MTLVVDAGAVVDLLLGRPAAAAIGRVLEADVDDLHAPGLLDLEVLSALRRLAAGGELTDQRAREAVDDLAGLPILRHGHVALLPRVWQLRANVTPYDAAYVALAEGLGDDAGLLTLDRHLARAVTDHTAVRTVLPDPSAAGQGRLALSGALPAPSYTDGQR